MADLAHLLQPSTPPLRGGPTLRWGILAPGGIAADWITAVQAHTDQEVVAVASRDIRRAQRFAHQHEVRVAYGAYDHLLGDPQVDIVYIAAPHSEHAPIALAAIAAGKHILVEKPFTTSFDDALHVITAARSSGVFVTEALWTAFLPQTSIVDALLREHAIGELHYAAADFGVHTPFAPGSRSFDPALGGGSMLDLGVYSSWFVHRTLGPSLTAHVEGTLAPTGVDTEAMIVTSHSNQAIGAAFSSLRSLTPHRATVSGHSGSINVGTPFWAPSGLTLHLPGATVEWRDRSGITGRNGLAYQTAAVARHIADGRTEAPAHPLSTTLDLQRLIEDSRRTLTTAQLIKPTSGPEERGAHRTGPHPR